MAELALLAGTLATGASTIAPYAAVASTVIGGAGTLMSANASKAAARAEAESLRQKGTEEHAASQRKAENIRRHGSMVKSRQLALAAKSGGGVSTPTVNSLIGGAEAQSFLNAAFVDSGGQSRRAGYYDAAAAKEAKAKYDYTGTLISGAADTIGSMSKWKFPEYSGPKKWGYM